VNGDPDGAIARIAKIVMLGGEDETVVRSAFANVLEDHPPDLLLSGENGDNRALRWYRLAESLAGPDAGIVRFKHLCGEYPTASAFALWLACNLPEPLPAHLIKRLPNPPTAHPTKRPGRSAPGRILLYNNYKFTQHSLILIEKYL
jgi:hypothetical protein